DLVALATAMKGLPLAYDRDLQEDKEPLFDAHDTLAGALGAMTALVKRLSFDVERMRAAAGDGSLLATDLAEHLVGRGLPFRDAHALVGGMVAALEDQGRTLADVAPDEWPAWSELFEPEAAGAATGSPEASVARRATAGGTSPASVAAQLAAVEGSFRPGSDGTAGVAKDGAVPADTLP